MKITSSKLIVTGIFLLLTFSLLRQIQYSELIVIVGLIVALIGIIMYWFDR